MPCLRSLAEASFNGKSCMSLFCMRLHRTTQMGFASKTMQWLGFGFIVVAARQSCEAELG